MDLFKTQLLQIVKERDELRTELARAKTVIIELENQNIELDRMLTSAHAHLYANGSARSSDPIPKVSWIGTWKRSDPLMYPALVPVETAWCNGYLQHALNMMPTLLERSDFGHLHRINARLLYSALIQSSGKELPCCTSIRGRGSADSGGTTPARARRQGPISQGYMLPVSLRVRERQMVFHPGFAS